MKLFKIIAVGNALKNIVSFYKKKLTHTKRENGKVIEERCNKNALKED